MVARGAPPWLVPARAGLLPSVRQARQLSTYEQASSRRLSGAWNVVAMIAESAMHHPRKLLSRSLTARQTAGQRAF